ncbi:MAG: hypothetical protein WDM92_11090 [Caulobacteraceae bacterium]
MLSEVNVVSAPAIAKERGITVTEIAPGAVAHLRQPDADHRLLAPAASSTSPAR